MKKIIFYFFISIPFLAFAQTENNAVQSSTVPVYSEATQTIKELVDIAKIYKDPNEKGISEEEKKSRLKIKNRISEILDLKEMAHLILINQWDKLKPQQREKYAELLSKMVEEIGYPQIGDYFNKKIEISYKGEKELAENKRAVLTEIFYPDEDLTLHTEFYMHKKNENWSVYDVVTDGDSLLLIYRNQHTKIIKEKGFDHLISLMQKKLNSSKESSK